MEAGLDDFCDLWFLAVDFMFTDRGPRALSKGPIGLGGLNKSHNIYRRLQCMHITGDCVPSSPRSSRYRVSSWRSRGFTPVFDDEYDVIRNIITVNVRVCVCVCVYSVFIRVNRYHISSRHKLISATSWLTRRGVVQFWSSSGGLTFYG